MNTQHNLYAFIISTSIVEAEVEASIYHVNDNRGTEQRNCVNQQEVFSKTL